MRSPVLEEPRDSHLLRNALHLACAGAGGARARPPGEAAGAQLGDAQRQRADAGGERPLAVAVAAVRPAAAQLVGLGIHHGVHDLLG